MHEEQEVTQTTPETDSAAEFEELIQGRCKQPFQQRVQKILDGRLRSLRQENEALRRQVLSDSAYLLWAATMLMHPIVPAGCEEICSYLNFQPETFFSWDHDFLTLAELAEQGEDDHPVRELPPRTDFFKKHPSQFKK